MAEFVNEDDGVFRSHFSRVNRLADRAYEQVRPAYRLGRSAGADPFNEGCGFEEIEKDLENGWLSVRVNGSDWASVREFVRAGFDRARQQSRIQNAQSSSASPDKASYQDPGPMKG